MTAERELSDRLIYAARPTVRVDGREHFEVTELLLAITMSECEGGLSSLEVRWSNVGSHADGSAELVFEAEDILALGSELTVYAGDSAQPQEIFRGAVTALEAEFSQDGPPELVALAEDALQLARRQRRTLLHKDLRISDLARSIGECTGLRAVTTGFGESIGPQMQLNESDLAFLRRLLRAYDGDLQVVGEELHVSPRDEVRRDDLTLELYGQLTRARVTADLAHQVTAVTVAGWDAEQATRVNFTSEGEALGPGRGRRGAEVLRDTIGPRSEHSGHVAVRNHVEARSMANASYDQRARRFVLLEGTSDGNPAIRVGAHVGIVGISARFDNTYYVTKACHRFDLKSGYSTDFEAECAYLGEA